MFHWWSTRLKNLCNKRAWHTLLTTDKWAYMCCIESYVCKTTTRTI
jgi:hypothetical protein